MKRSTSFMVAAMAAMALAAPAQAQLTFDWDENGQFKLYAEDLVCEGGVSYDEDESGFVFDGTPGRIMINIPEGMTWDWSMVASIQVFGTLADENGEDQPLTSYAWNPWDPMASFTVRDRDIRNSDDDNIVNTWMGSRYNVNYAAIGDKEYHNGKSYAALSPNVTAAYWGTRDSEDGEINENATTQVLYIDEVVFTKSVEKDPLAISDDMFFEWTNWDETAEIVSKVSCEYNLETNLGVGSVLYGTSVVLGKQFADLTEFDGIYGKGTPGVSLRLLFNRPDMEGGSAPITECNPVFDDNGEFYFYFTELADAEVAKFGEAYPYVHLNTVKMPWGFPEGVSQAKVTKLNYIPKGAESGIETVKVDTKDNVIYNIYGQKVNAGYKGIVIMNGKKYINK